MNINILPKNFDWKSYLENYPDLREAGIKTESDAISHYLNYGRYENREYLNYKRKLPKNFDWVEFFSINLELCELNIDKESFEHYFINFSKKDNREHTAIESDIESQNSIFEKKDSIYIFYHVYAKNDWKKIFIEQIELIFNSGLYEKVDKFFINISGEKEHYEYVDKYFKNEEKKVNLNLVENEFEFPTLELISDVSKKERFKGLYLHSKSTSYAEDHYNKNFYHLWREIMNYHNILQWKECLHRLETHDLVGTLFRKGTSDSKSYWQSQIYSNLESLSQSQSHNIFGCTNHYSGNFWWFNSEYYATIPKLEKKLKLNRFNAEWYVFYNNPNSYNFYVNKNYWIQKLKNLINEKKTESKTHQDKTQNFSITKNHHLKKADISVIISLYNYQNYIQFAVDSVINNNYKSCEIVIVNDASTDSSLEMVMSYLNTTNNITIIDKKTNTGLVDTRNLGIDNCVGEYVFILDADNQIYQNCLTKHIERIKKTNAIACYSTIECYDENGNHVRSVSNSPFSFEKLKNGNYIDAMAMFNKRKLIALGKYDVEMAKVGIGWEDYELWLRIGTLDLNVEFIDEILSIYTVKGNSMLSSTNSVYRKQISQYLNKKYEISVK